jgi:tetratricopeptide (TPR) repeat protein
MRKLYTIVGLLFFIPIISQNIKIDSLTYALNHSKNDIAKIELLNALAAECKTSNPKKMALYANQALQLAIKIDNKLESAQAYLHLGTSAIILGRYSSALQYFSEAQIIYENALMTENQHQDQVKQGLAKSYGSIGIVFSEQSSYAKALQYYLKALKCYEDLKDESRIAVVYNNIGVVYKATNDNFKALDYFIKSHEIQEKTDGTSLGFTATNIGNLYLKQRNYAKALQYYTQAAAVFKSNHNPRGEGELYNNLGLYYQQIGNAPKALESWDKALQVFGIENKFGVSDTYYHLGNFYVQQKKFPAAIENVEKALKIAKELQVLEMQMLAEHSLSTIYQKLQQPQNALEHLQNYTIIKDSLASHENIRKSVQETMRFEFDKKEALQKKELEKKDILFKEHAKRQKMQLLFVVLFLILASGIVFLIHNRRQLKKTLTLQKELAEYEQKALHLQMNPHFVFNCLGSISSFIVQNGTDSAIKYLSKFSKLMRLTLEYSKESLIPIDKEMESLQNYLELEQLRFNNVFDFKITKGIDIEDDMAVPPLLLQPFVENAIIHGLVPKKESGVITVDFSVEEDHLVCTILDDGIGFEKSQELKENLVEIHKSMALDITKKRLEMMEASTMKKSTVTIQEMRDATGRIKGTRVVLQLPIQYVGDL